MTNEPASTTSAVVLRLVARLAAKELLLSTFATNEAYSVPVVALARGATMVNADVHV